MNAPAVPRYVTGAAGNFDGCPPGHRFNLYFPIWNDGWQLDKNGKAGALGECLKLGDAAEPLKALLARQQTYADTVPEDRRHIIEGRSTSPFATGLGLEHPVENGFAFLSPYGLPYLAGSGVKGVLRRAAEELDLDGELPVGTVLTLFGHEDANDARRGALTCWDVFPAPSKDEMVVEIMTPHFSHYYHPEKGKEHLATPHDAGKPNPIPFLAVPAGSAFRFVITCEPGLLGADIPEWKAVLDKIIRHAFDWLGFGAKTAVGYGAIAKLSDVEVSAARAHAAAKSKRCEWVDRTLDALCKQTNAKPEDALRSKGLAEAWKSIEDPVMKSRAKADIVARRQAHGWWDSPPGKASRQAKAIYMGNETS